MEKRIAVRLRSIRGWDTSSVSAVCGLVYEPADDVPEAVREANIARLSTLAHRIVREGLQRGDVGASAHCDDDGSLQGRVSHVASQRQLRYARQLAKQVPELGARQLDALAKHVFAKSLVKLSSIECSSVIDLLKDFKAGRLEVPPSLNGATW